MKKGLQKRLIRVAKVLEKLDSLKKKAGFYTLKMNPQEYNDLAWLADRYESARVLYDGLECADDVDVEYTEDCGTFKVPEHVLWEAYEATKEDGGAEGQIPNLGGDLGKQIYNLFNEMV